MLSWLSANVGNIVIIAVLVTIVTRSEERR